VKKDMPSENENLRGIIERIACKYAALVEERIDKAQNGLTGTDLREIYDGVQMLGNITATLKRFSRMKM
jgi:hypothetical protein